MTDADVPTFDIVIPIYEGVDLMDVAGPYEFFSWLAGSDYKNTRQVTITLVAETIDPVKSRDNFLMTPNQTFDYYKDKGLQANLIWTPGGNPDNLHYLMQPGTPYLNFLTSQAEKADWVTSVCEGALLLAAAGLLNGYQATTHWAFLRCLAAFPQISIAPGYPRFVVDGNRVTGGGISSGLDEALELIQLIAGTSWAEQVQLNTQYYPEPPVNSTIPRLGLHGRPDRRKPRVGARRQIKFLSYVLELDVIVLLLCAPNSGKIAAQNYFTKEYKYG